MSDVEKENDFNLQDVCQGQTDQERREIRKQQRRLHKEIEEGGEELGVDEARERNNKIFGNVRFVREAVLDGENVNLIATKAAQKVDKLIQVREMKIALENAAL